MRFCVALAVALLAAGPASAQSNLEPDTSAFASEPRGYNQLVSSVVEALKDAYTPDVRVRAIVMPALHGDYAVGLKQKKSGYVAFVLKLPVMGTVISSSCEAPVDNNSAQQMVEVWRQMLVHTSYLQTTPPKELMLDGAEYHFSLPSYPPDNGGPPMPNKKYEAMQGRIFNPDRGSKPRALTDIVDDLENYCLNKDRKSLVHATQTASDLLNRLKSNN